MDCKVLVVTSSRNLKRRVARALGSVGISVDACPLVPEDLQGRLAAGQEMCLIDADEDHRGIRWLLTTLYKEHPHVISLLVSHSHENEFLIDLLADQNLNNLIAKHGGVAASTDLIDEMELMVTCRKLFLRDIFGIEKYLPTWGVQIHDFEIAASDDKNKLLAELERFLDVIDCHDTIRNSVLLAADELVMNAIFNAPRDAAGQPKYSERDRRDSFRLETTERVQVRYACDGRHVGLSVTDLFGSLRREVIVSYIRRCLGGAATIMAKKAGAGLGLYMIFRSITQLAFNIQAGVKTEAIALFYVRSGPRAFRTAGRSLNIFLLQ